MDSKVTPLYAETRILLNLWTLDEPEVSRSKFLPSSKNKEYKKALETLAGENALSLRQKTKSRKVYSLTDEGKQRLAEGLVSDRFQFPAQIGAKTANAVLKWWRQQEGTPAIANGNGKVSEIESYEEFTDVALSTYDQLNKDFNLRDLVPIYRIRRTIGDRIARSDFNDWMLKMQANDVFQLMESSIEDGAAKKLEDSVMTKTGTLRCYAKRLSD